MKTFKNIDEFVVETFPLEHNKIVKQQKTPIEESVENIDNNFNRKLEKIMQSEDIRKK
jgi:predicted component of type VI protein secretion system